jgi:hypothetical protein
MEDNAGKWFDLAVQIEELENKVGLMLSENRLETKDWMSVEFSNLLERFSDQKSLVCPMDFPFEKFRLYHIFQHILDISEVGFNNPVNTAFDLFNYLAHPYIGEINPAKIEAILKLFEEAIIQRFANIPDNLLSQFKKNKYQDTVSIVTTVLDILLRYARNNFEQTEIDGLDLLCESFGAKVDSQLRAIFSETEFLVDPS